MAERKDGKPKLPRTDGEWRRADIIEAVEENPGINLRAIARELDCAVSTVEYQIPKLVKQKKIRRRRDGHLVRFYPTGNSSS